MLQRHLKKNSASFHDKKKKNLIIQEEENFLNKRKAIYEKHKGSSIPGSGRSPGEGNGNPLQYSCLENSMDRGVWQATVHGVAKSRMQLSD